MQHQQSLTPGKKDRIQQIECVLAARVVWHHQRADGEWEKCLPSGGEGTS